MGCELIKKEKQSIRFLKSLDGLELELAYSGGKDSDVILALAQMAGIKFKPIYKLTTIDPPGTVKHVKVKGVEVRNPKNTFFEIIEKKGFPTRRARFCCEQLKEYKILDKAILGIRRSESTKRNKLYKEPTICRIYSGTEKVEQFLPILNWNDRDISEFVTQNNVACHPLYYDENGTFRVERRLGCMGCPLKADKGKSDFLKYPNLVKQWIKRGRIWMNTHPTAKSNKKFVTSENLFFHNVFCDSYEDYILKTTGLFGNLDCKKWLEDYFKIEL